MTLEIILGLVYLLCGVGAYRAYRLDGQSQTVGILGGVFWPIPVLIIYLMMGLNSQAVLNKIKYALKGVKK